MNYLVSIFQILLILPSFFHWNNTPFVDLEEQPDSFIIESKEIKIPGYPDAFNPSIVRHKNSFLMIFRVRDPILRTTNQMGLVWLDKNYKLLSKPYLLEMRHLGKKRSMAQDPRLIQIGRKIYLVYNDTLESPYKDIRRMLIAKLHFDGKTFFIQEPEMLTDYDHEIWNRHEKNWAPFVYHGHLYLTYGLSPHKILKPLLGQNRCRTIASTPTKSNWDYGELRGGTQCYLLDNEYLGFFHSSIDMKTAQSNGKKMTHYFMGAYTFQKDPPFAIRRVSKHPIIGTNFYNGPTHKTWKPLRVVFPGGFAFDEKFIWVAYGRQDHEIWIVKMSRKGLLKSLIMTKGQ